MKAWAWAAVMLCAAVATAAGTGEPAQAKVAELEARIVQLEAGLAEAQAEVRKVRQENAKYVAENIRLKKIIREAGIEPSTGKPEADRRAARANRRASIPEDKIDPEVRRYMYQYRADVQRGYYNPGAFSEPMRKGMVTRFGSKGTIYHVIDETNMLVKTHTPSDMTEADVSEIFMRDRITGGPFWSEDFNVAFAPNIVWVEGYPTEGLVDKQLWKCHQLPTVFRVTGTKQYGNRTVFAMELFDVNAYLASLQEEAAPAE